MSGITFITGNQHKADNLARLLGLSIDHVKLDLDEIQSAELREVVEHKARQAFEIVQRPVVVDDVGLGFSALGGLPGPFIKFFVHAGAEKLCSMLDGFNDRSATGKAGIGYCDENGFRYFEGKIHGVIAEHPRGEGGFSFGWDSIFEPEGYGGRTRAELTQDEYDEVYRRIRPISELKTFLDGKETR
jgi:non-canonical purine NTP pyrophosphatase (RdgB/HAM1 family)